MTDLFDHGSVRYPQAPGHKGNDGTSLDAAESLKPCVHKLRLIALRTIDQLGDEATPIEAITKAQFDRHSLELRFSELRRMGYLEPTGARRPNPSGKAASVLRLTPAGLAVLNG